MESRKQAFTGLSSDREPGPIVKSVEGFVLIVTGLPDELQEEDLHDKFGEHGEIKNCVLNLDRRTGYVKGYALLEYASLEEAQQTIADFDQQDYMGKTLRVDWAFKKKPRH